MKSQNVNAFKQKTWLVKVLIWCSFAIAPALILLSQEKAQKRMKALKDKITKKGAKISDSDLEESQHLSEFLKECRMALLTFRRNELGIEIVIQLSIHLAMVLLSQTPYPAIENLSPGFVSLFQDKNDEETSTLVFLVISILWSFKTSALTSIKIKADSKNYLPLTPKLLLGTRYLLIFLVRISCLVTYFSPSLGLLGMMNHHHAERFPLDPKIWKNLNKTDFHYLSAITGQHQTIPVSELFRSNNPTDGTPSSPPITLYTYITLKTAYILFGAFFVVYALLLLLIKTKISDRFASASWGEKLQHLIDVVNVPDPFQDWDSEENLEIRMQAKLWKSTLIEMFVMIGLQLLTNLLLLTPFWIAGTIQSLCVTIMALPVMEFQDQGYKIRKVFA